MRALRIRLCMVAVLSVVVTAAQAKTNYAYVANNSAGTVSVINISTGLVVKTIPVGSFPYAVAVDEAGKFAYVTNSGSGTVSVISTGTNAVVATVTVPGAFTIALSPNGKTAYVTTGSAVAVVNTVTRVVTANIPVTNPIGLAVTPNGAFLYVVSSSAGNVLAISTLTHAVVATIPVGTNIPIDVAISSDGYTAYVTNYNAHTVSVIQTATNTVVNTINVSAGPFEDSVSPDGHWLYVAHYNAGGGTLVTIIDTASQTVASTVVVGTGPEFIAFSQDSGFAYVANITSNNVSVINTASRTVVNTITVGTAPVGVGVMGTMKVSTVIGGYVGDKGPATSAAIEGPSSSLIDAAGNVYVSDFFGSRIRKITPTGTITTYAGTGFCGYNGDNIKAGSASLCVPAGLAWDGSNNMIVADGGNGRIRKISSAGIITTIAGNGTFGSGSGDGGPATSADIGQTFFLAYDSTGNLYLASECRIRKVDTSGIITTAAGTGVCGYNGDGIPATTAELNGPHGVAVDGSGNLYIGDWGNHRVRKVDLSGTITTFAGTGQGGFSGDGGLATAARVGNPRGLTIYNGSLYISHAGSARVRFVNLSTNIINTYAGSFFGYDGDGHSLTATEFSLVGPVLFDSSGNPYFTDTFNSRLRKATGGIVNTFAGGYLGDGGKATAAALVLPEALAIDKNGNFYIADWIGNRVRKVSGGTISTVAGTGVSGYSGDTGPGTSATLYGPQGVAVDSTGNVFIADTYNRVIREVNTGGTISTFASNPNFSDLLQMATDSGNNLYVADDRVCVVWKITPAAVVSIVAGVLNTCGYNGDGINATTAQLNGPHSVAVDTSGNLFIADNGNNRIREVNTAGTISTVTGDGNCTDNGDGGPATAAEICSPYGVAVAHSGTVYTTDGLYRIRQISGGVITSLAGAGFGFNGDGLWPLLTAFDGPVAVALDAKGVVYVLDDWDHRVRQIK